MEKKYLYIIIVAIAFVIIGYMATQNKVSIEQDSSFTSAKTKKIIHPELGEIPLPEVTDLPTGMSDTPKLIKKENSREQINIKESDNNSKILKPKPLDDEAVIQEALKDFTDDNALIEDALTEIGFEKEGIDSIVSKNKDSLLSIENMPDEIRKDILIELEKSKKNGFDEVDDKDADEITGIINSIVGTTLDIPNITFVLSKLPTSVIQNYQYIGYTFPNSLSVNNPNIQHDTVQRVFQSLDSTSILIIEESSLRSGGAILLKEFVNTTIDGLPAIYAIKKSKSQKTYAMLNWTTNSFAYSLYQIGAIENARDILQFVGTELSQINSREKKAAGNSELPTLSSGLPQN